MRFPLCSHFPRLIAVANAGPCMARAENANNQRFPRRICGSPPRSRWRRSRSPPGRPLATAADGDGQSALSVQQRARPFQPGLGDVAAAFALRAAGLFTGADPPPRLLRHRRRPPEGAQPRLLPRQCGPVRSTPPPGFTCPPSSFAPRVCTQTPGRISCAPPAPRRWRGRK